MSFVHFISISSILFLLHLISLAGTALALPLSTNSRWIVDDKEGQRVKLACVNWPSHIDTMVAEGLSMQPIDVISQKIMKMGFNCVRLTWPIYLVTNHSLASQNVQQSFMNYGLSRFFPGLQANNPSFLQLSLVNAFKAVVASLTKSNVMVILDNHVSKPGWCCGSTDGNGFFGDQFFNPHLWIKGLTTMAKLFEDNPHVVGMSLRNELRGPNQNTKDWYKYMQRGAEALHKANPNVLVILSGLRSDVDLNFLSNQAIHLTFEHKLVFEVHWYSFSDGRDTWSNGNPNEVCQTVVKSLMSRAGFLLDQGFPLFVSEFGLDLRGISVDDNRYFNCFLAWAAEFDLDWAMWTLAGSYYVRKGSVGLDEPFGVLDYGWSNPRNASFLQRLSLIQSAMQGPGLPKSERHNKIFHPATGLCIIKKTNADDHSRKRGSKSAQIEPLKLGPCSDSDHWNYTPQKTLTIKGTCFFLQAQGLHQPAGVGLGRTRWETISASKLHLSTRIMGNNSTVCLDVDSDNNVVTASCKCLSRDNKCDPGSQWFKIVDAGVKCSR